MSEDVNVDVVEVAGFKNLNLSNDLSDGYLVLPYTFAAVSQLRDALNRVLDDLVPAQGAPKTLGALALEVALEEYRIEAGERGANNMGPFVLKYLNGLAEPPANWCAGFVSWCYSQAAKRLGRGAFPYTVGARQVLRNAEDLKGYLNLPSEPGDVVVWFREGRNSGLGHVGMLVKRSPPDSKGKHMYEIIEGNRGEFPSKVRIFQYTEDELTHVGRESGYLGAGRFK